MGGGNRVAWRVPGSMTQVELSIICVCAVYFLLYTLQPVLRYTTRFP